MPVPSRRMSTEDTGNDPDTFSTPTPSHISDVNTWGHPDRNFFLFVALTFLFGFFGVDHMYLRSNTTAFKKLLMNVCGLGIWWIWDIIQVLKDGKTVRKQGLNSPFDWIRGIGRGTFLPLPIDQENGTRTNTNAAEFAAPKSYFLYTLLAIGLGIFGADKFYLGQNWQGFAKVFSVFNIFLFLFGILWVVWDAVHAYFMTESILEKGIQPPVPFSWMFGTIDANVFKVQEVPSPSAASNTSNTSFLPSLRDVYRELVVPVLQPTVGSAIQKVEKVVNIGNRAAMLGTSALAAGPGLVSSFVNQAADSRLEALQSAASAAAASRMTGGGISDGPVPVLAGAFTAILLAGGLKGMYDFLSKQMS